MKKTLIALGITIATVAASPVMAQMDEAQSLSVAHVTGWLAFFFAMELLVIVGVQFLDRPRRKKPAESRPVLRALPDPVARESSAAYALFKRKVL